MFNSGIGSILKETEVKDKNKYHKKVRKSTSVMIKNQMDILEDYRMVWDYKDVGRKNISKSRNLV